ncbi:MAG: hypothetical protein KDB08_05045 [Microthrixaceae bacterium]|nr:hypothetical protein [Microthrixaceae bacterium]
MRKRTFAALTAIMAIVLGGLVAPTAALADNHEAALNLSKSVVGTQTQFAPGDRFDYEIQVGCSSPTTPGCVDAFLVDTLPAPLVLDPAMTNPVVASIAGGGNANISTSTDANGRETIRVEPEQAFATGTGLKAGDSMLVTVSVFVPTTTSGEFNGATVTNTAVVDASNADEVPASADVTLAVQTTLAPSLTKTVAPTSTLPAVPGRAIDWTLTPGNASNQSVDTIVVQDPATPPLASLGYLDITGIEVVAPAGATDTRIEYYIDSAWTTTLLGDADGVRVTFTGAFAPGASGTVVVRSETNDKVTEIAKDAQVAITNDALTTVSKNGTSSAPVKADASVTVANQDPDVTVTKRFDRSDLVSGQSTIANIVATVGAQNVKELRLTEPSAGQPNFTAQGLRFDGFGDELEWPEGATSAKIDYVYADCAPSSATTTTAHTLGAPTPNCVVEGFTVTFRADGDDIPASAYAVLPLKVTALPVTTTTVRTGTNHVDVRVENADGASGTDAADASVTVAPLLVDTEVSKAITPGQVFGVPGTDARVTLTGKVHDDSTIGSESLIISDPADPAAAPEFWDAFAPTAIDNTDIAVCTSLTVRYWSKQDAAWTTFPGAEAIAGPVAKWGLDIPANLRADIGGIQYEVLPTCGGLLPPGFVMHSYMQIEVTEHHSTQATYTNVAQSAVHNPDAIVPDATDDAQDDITVVPVTGGGGPGGADLIDKAWLDTSVPALSKERRELRLGWRTQGLNLTSVAISDPGSEGERTNVGTSVYDAFNLVEIRPVTPATDPLIVNDRVTKVELYTGAAGDPWQDITAAACANGCDGRFGGYTLSAEEQQSALGVRITFTERTAGAGVGSSYEHRPLNLVFELRDKPRSNPSGWVLGNLHSTHTYNTGEPGWVNNTVSARGVNAATGVDVTSRANDEIQIIDSPLNVTMTKTFDQEQLGIPQVGTDQADFPLISSTIRAVNTSATRIASMVITDPDPTQAAPVFDVLNLYAIGHIGIPTGLTAAEVNVKLTRAGGGTSEHDITQAQALTPASLADVTAISLSFARADGLPVIAAGAAGELQLTWQLRATHRTTGDPVTTPQITYTNIASTQIDSPGRVVCPANGCSTGFTTANDSFQLVEAEYSVVASKSIDPATVAENGSKQYTSTLAARPAGNARTTLLQVTDFEPTFWNTMDYVSSSLRLPAPVNQVKMDVLVDAAGDVEYLLTPEGKLQATCDGNPVDPASACIVEGEWVAGTSGSTVALPLPTGVDPATVVGVRYSVRRVVDGQAVQWERPHNPQLNFKLQTTRRDTLRSDPATGVSTTRPGLAPNPGETVAGTITNALRANGVAQFGAGQQFTDQADVSATTRVTHLTNAIKVTKTRGSTNTVNPAGPVNFVMEITNTGQWDMTGFALTDQIGLIDGVSPLVEPMPSAYGFAITGPGAPTGNAGFSASLNTTTGALSIVNADPAFVFKSGWKLTISAPLRFRPGLSPDETVTNRITATADRAFERCESTTTDLVPKAVTTGVAECTADTAVVPRASATVAMKKWAKGDGAGDPATTRDDLGVLNVIGDGEDCNPSTPGLTSDGFTSYPCAPITRPGGEASWRLDFQNTGNTAAKVVAAVDVLPAPGDRGVLVGSARGSQFAVALLGKLGDNLDQLTDGALGTVRAYYSPAVLSASCNTNAVQVHTANATPNAGCAFNWVEFTAATPESELAAARSIKFVTEFSNLADAKPGPGLQPGETLSLTFNTRTPYLLPAEGADAEGTPVAYNSFAGSSRTVATLTQPERAELVLEPQRVGIATATGQLNLKKVVEAPTFSGSIQLPASYQFLVTCDSGGQRATLLNAAGADASRPSVAGDGTVLLYNAQTGPVNLPLFANCNITEPNPPAGVTVTTPTATVVAERDLSEDPAVWSPYIGATQTANLQITNEFHAGGFSVSKAVDAGGAVDQDGTAIVYDQEFDFTASCMYLGQETVPVADRTFSLADDETKRFAGLPTGAECTITEVDRGLAGTTTVTIVEDTVTEVSGGVTIAEFVIGDETAVTSVLFTNAMTVGSLAIDKVVTGAGAADFGQGPFTMHVVCTLDTAAPNTVYDGELILGGSEPLTKQIANLPTGAECVVTETDAAGAQDVAIAPSPAVIGVANVVTVTVTNTFTIGSLQIEKRIEGPGAALYGAGPFEVTLECVLGGSAVTIPGGASRVLDAQGGYTARYDSLPVGAVCGIEETETGGASAVAIQDDAGNPITEVTITAAVTPTEVVLVNTFDLGAIEVSKLVSGDPTGDHAQRVFEIELRCELGGNAIAIPGGETRALTVADGVLYTDLPIGAECTLVETDNGGAVRTTMTPANGADDSTARVIVTAGAAASITVENTYEVGLPLTGGERAMWMLPLGALLLGGGAGFVLVSAIRRRRTAE